MTNIKEQHHAGRLTASGVSLQLEIDYHHNQWCLDNGYKPQATSLKHQAQRASSSKLQAPSNEHQASSREQQAL
jgi:hypothetical protein